MVIESKRAAISLEEGIAQLLSYMLGSPNGSQPTFGLITNGGSFLFANLDAEVRLDIANLLWMRQDFLLNPAFVEQVTEFYNAEAANLNFNRLPALIC